MKNNYIVEIIKNDKVLANCYYDIDLESDIALFDVINLFFNYNTRLSHSKLSEKEFALAFLQASDEDLKNPIANVRMLESSIEYMKKTYGGAYAEDLSDEIIGYIGITEEDIEINENTCNYGIYIDIEKKALGLQIFDVYTLDEYAAINKIAIEELDTTNIPKVSFNPDYVLINELEEVEEFLRKNRYFMFEGDDENIYITVN